LVEQEKVMAKSYRVVWEVDVEADTPEEAAAAGHQQIKDSVDLPILGVRQVNDRGETVGEEVAVDLEDYHPNGQDN
jgi:hypothetical protein